LVAWCHQSVTFGCGFRPSFFQANFFESVRVFMGGLRVSIEEARQKLPLKMLMTQYGHDPKNGKWKDMACPFCKASTGSGIFERAGKTYFKCHHTSCPTGTKALDEVGYIAQEAGLSRKDAFQQYLKMTGVWKEPRHAPSVLPGQRARRVKPPEEFPQTPSAGAGAEGSGAASESPYCKSDEGAAKFPSSSKAGLREEYLGGDGSESAEVKDQGETPGGDLPADADGASPESDGNGASADHGGGAGEPPHDPADEGGEDDNEDKALAALREFYGHLVLTEADANELRQKRGLTPDTSRLLGFKTNCQQNHELLIALGDKYPIDVLVKCGLWTKKEDKSAAKPNAQFYGWGVVGKRDKEFEWGWKEDGKCNPILIPYFNASGELIHLRPHKGMVSGGSPRAYCVRVAGQSSIARDLAVIAEGEFKAAALFQVLGTQINVAAIPGVTMSKFWLIEQELDEWLKAVQAKTVVVAFDNEEKGDPSLESFKPDRRKWFDAEVWARYLAERMRRQGFEGKIARLPNEWRNANGKADWDGALAKLMEELESHGEADRQVRPTIHKAFWDVIRQAESIEDLKQAKLFEDADEQLIQSAVARLFYVPKLPIGGDKEFGIGMKLARLARGLDLSPASKWFIGQIAKAYRETKGRYYNLKPLKEQSVAKWLISRQAAWQASDLNKVWVCDTVLKGFPNSISDFFMEGFFLLLRLDGKRDRIVKIHNVYGEVTDLEPWDARSMSRPSDFREWLANRGNFKWGGNERDLQALHEDMNRSVAFKNVCQVAAYGDDRGSQLWFFRDGAIGVGKNGSITVVPDELGIYWHGGLGYMLSEKGKENQAFRQGTPMMHPNVLLSASGLDIARFRHWPKILPAAPANEDEWIRAFFRELCERLKVSLGSSDAYLAVSIILAFAAAPEVFAKYGSFPGLWIHGQTSSGKTTLASWLMELFGFHNRESGLGLKSNVTPAGFQIAMEQYSNLPLWGDEYEHDGVIREEIRGLIHASYNREVPSKWAADGVMRVNRTNLMVTGESTPSRGATRSRFALIQTAKEKRLGTPEEQSETFLWMQDHRSFFFASGGRFCGGARSTRRFWCVTSKSGGRTAR
jgi:hypothetical protein